MKTSVSVRVTLSLILVILCLVWWVSTTVLYANLPVIITKPVLFDDVLGYGLLFFLCAHVALLYTTLPEAGKFSGLRNAALFLGTLSFGFLFYDFLSLNEMGNEYRAGYPWAGMVKMLWTMQGFHLLYYTVALVFFLKLRRLSHGVHIPSVWSGKTLFDALNRVGMAAGLNGTLLVVSLMFMMHQMSHTQGLHAVFVFAFGYFLLPWVLVWIPWLAGLIRHPADKELRFRIGRISAITLACILMLVTSLLVISLIQSPLNRNFSFTDMNVSLLWLPLMFYSALLVNSVAGIIPGRKRKT